MLDLIDVQVPLLISQGLIIFIGIKLLKSIVKLFGYLNVTLFFLVFFLSAAIVLLPKVIDENYVTGGLSIWYQTNGLFSEVSQIALMALVCMYLGWDLKIHNRRTKFNLFKNSPLKIEALFWTSVILGFAFAYISLPKITLLTATYREILVTKASQDIKATNALALFSLNIAYFAYLLKPTRIKQLAAFGLFLISFIYCGLLAGGRVEQLGSMMGLVITYQWHKRMQIPKRVLIYTGALLFILFSVVGLLRSENGLSGARPIYEYYSSLSFLNTQKDVMTTSIVVVGLEKDGFIEMDYGKTLLNVFASTLPRNFDSERPEQFDTKISEIAQWPGGSFVINEPYISGGIIGIAVSFFLIGALFKKIENYKSGMYQRVIYLGFVCGLPRFVYYGWLPAYRYITIAVAFCIIVWCLGLIFDERSNKGI